MSDVTTTTPGSTVTEGGEAQAQAQSTGVTDQAAATQPDQQAALNAEQDLGLLASAKPVEGAPEAYESFKFPEGIDVSEGDVDELKAIAKEMNLPQAAAQVGAEMTARALSKLIADAKTTQDAWKAEQKTMWEKQPNFAEATLKAQKALKHAGVFDYVRDNGYLYDATLLKAFAAFGELVSEGKVITGESAPPQKTHPYGQEWK